VTTNGTAGSYNSSVTIYISSSTPSPLYYQCENHDYMGYKVEIVSDISSSNIFSILLDSFTINFDEFVNINSSRNIYLYNKTTNNIDITIAATQLVQSSDGKSITYETGFSKYNVNSLEFDTSYVLFMDKDLAENIYYNTVSGDIETYVDISGYPLLEFGTESIHEPTFISITPDSSDTLIELSGYIIIEFDEPVTIPQTSDIPSGSTDNYISFIDTNNNSVAYVVTGDSGSLYESSGNELYIYYSGLSYNTSYNLSFGEYSIVDSSNIPFTITDSSLSNYSVQTIEDPTPQLQYFIPNDDISNIYIDQPISLIFDRTVYLDTSNNGRIEIDNITSNTVFDVFDISNSEDISGFIFGSGTNTIRIYPFETDISFESNINYSVSITSDAIADICNNYYSGITTTDTNPITFTTGDTAGDAQESLTNETTGNIVTDDDGNNYITFNGETAYESKQYTLSVGKYILNISDSYPITLLNNNLSDMLLLGISNEAIEIDVSGGTNTPDTTTDDHFVFTNSNGTTISLANGDLKFMRGQTYKFNNTGITNSYFFELYYDDTVFVLTDSSGTFTLPEDMSTDDNSLYYCAKVVTNTGSGGGYGDYYDATTTTTTSYDVSLTLLYTSISETNENGNGSYDFYYGNVVVDVCNNDFGSLSFYTYNNGYMGGKYAFTFEDNYYG